MKKLAIIILALTCGMTTAQDAKRIKLEPEEAVHFLIWSHEVETDDVKINALKERQKKYQELIKGLVEKQRAKLGDTKLDLRWIEDSGSIFFEEVPTVAPIQSVAPVTTR